MDSPYRSGPATTATDAPRDAGIVDDVVAQFADPLAFYRELVQNAIDAGSPEVEVRIARDAAAEVTRVAVRDDGEGMDRDVVENQLLVLFRSTKERDDTKIGKFGIGFSSVLAPGPRVVVIRTVRGGQRLIVHLRPDLGYELFDGGPATRPGTTVELELAMPADEVPRFVARSRAALERWCRHATVPIHLHAPDEPPVRIDGPLDLTDVVASASGTGDDGAIQVVVGIPGRDAGYAGFFNHGLMLYETTEPLLPGLAFKVQDARLGHTLSRDNVRRDAAFHRALGFVRAFAERTLPAAAARALHDAAAGGDRGAYRAAAEAIAASGVALARRDWVFPLLAPVGDRRVVSAEALDPRRPWGARVRSPLVAALTAAGVPLVDLGPVTEPWMESHVARVADVALVDVDRELTLVEPAALTPSDELLVRALRDLLDAAHRAPPAITIADLVGEANGALAVAGAPDDAVIRLGDGGAAPYVLDRKRAHRNPFGLLRRPALILRASSPHVAAARRRAVDDPDRAAALLARALLLRAGRLDVDRSEVLLDEALARLGLGGPR